MLVLLSAARCHAQTERDRALTMFQEAGRLRDAGEYKAAMEKYEQLLPSLPGLFGEASAPVIGVTSELASVYTTLGRFSKAEEFYKRSLQLQTDSVGEASPKVAKVLNGLANLNQQQGRIAEAESNYRKSVAICRKAGVINDPIFSVALNGLALVCTQNGSYAEAENLYGQSLEICLNTYGQKSEEAAVLAGNIAQLFFEQGKYGDAENWFSRSLGVQLQLFGDKHPSVANTAASLGALHYRLGRYDSAEFYLKKSLIIYEMAFPAGSLGTLNVLNVLGQVASAQNHEAEARNLYQKAFAMANSLGLGDHFALGATLTNQGVQKTKLGEIQEAEADFSRALEIFRKTGNQSPSVAMGLNNLAAAYQRSGKFAEAEKAQTEGLAIWKNQLGEDHPYVVVGSSNLARLYQSMQRWQDALNKYDGSRRSAYRHTMEVVSSLPEQDQLNFLVVQDRVHLHRALSLAISKSDLPEAPVKTMEWVVNSKGLAAWSRAQTMAWARESQSPETAGDLAELKEKQHQLSRLTLLKAESSPSSPAAQEAESQISKLSKRKNELMVKLQRVGSAAVAERPWISQSQLQAALSVDAKLIDFMRLNVYDPDKESIQTERYIAWITGKDNTSIVDLGAAKPIENAIAKVRQKFETAAADIADEGAAASEEKIQRELETLSKQLLHPILPYLKDTKRLVLSPDADLWLVPWNSLILPNQKFVIEDHVLQYVVNAGELVKPSANQVIETTAPVIIADPDFSGSVSTESNGRGFSEDLKLSNVSRLYATAAEANVVRAAFKEYYKQEPVALLQSEATAPKLLSVQRPVALALATHGFYLPLQSASSGEVATMSPTRSMVSIEDPLLRCGVLLAGCNLPDNQGLAGVVTGRDILSLDLRGCQMVILSACETGLGDVEHGDGVAGLRQAFHLAGAQNVVASLWRVPDVETGDQMKSIMKHLVATRDLALALAEAQREMLNSIQATKQSRHPYLWAAFNVTSTNVGFSPK